MSEPLKEGASSVTRCSDGLERGWIAIIRTILIAVSIFSLFGTAAECVNTAAASPDVNAVLHGTYGRLPLSFAANQGQTDGQVKFYTRGNGYAMFFTATEAVLALRNSRTSTKPTKTGPTELKGHANTSGSVLRITLVGGNPRPRVAALEQLPGNVNYFINNNPQGWHTSIPTYAKLKYLDVYPGVDLVFYGNQRQLEYDFIIGPGADPNNITLGFHGAHELKIDGQGDLLLLAPAGQIRLQRPNIYQEIGGTTRTISGRYVLTGRHQVSFQVGAYDATRPLIIDPILLFSTYVGGSAGDEGASIAVDASGHAYVTGYTLSLNFPTQNPLQSVFSGIRDAFVAKLNPAGSGLVYSTYLGGSGDDEGASIAVDASGHAYVTGETASKNFPTTPGTFQASFGAGYFKAFVAKLSPAGSLVYSTYLGGNNGASGRSIAVDASGHAYVTGDTSSPNFPTTSGAFQPSFGGYVDAFVAKLNPTGSALVYSTYLGGAGMDSGFGIALDTSLYAYVTGLTYRSNFPTANPLQAASGGGYDAFVAKLNPTGSALVYSTYLGGSGLDFGTAITVDALGNAYLTGATASANFPTAAGAFQVSNAGEYDAFVTKLNPTGSTLVYSTYLGGSGTDFGLSSSVDDAGTGIAVDCTGSAYVTGFTLSSNFPTANPLQAASGGGYDAFVAKLNPAGSGLVYSTYLGGSGYDTGEAIAVDASGNVYATGNTHSPNFPLANPLQPAYAGGGVGNGDAFVAKISTVAPVFCGGGGGGRWCRKPLWICSNPPREVGPGLIVLSGHFVGYRVFDPIPKNCLIKFNCPGCPAGGLCPPFYHVFFDGLGDAWNVALIDGNGNPAPHQQFKTPAGIAISFRPSEEHYIDGQIGNYFFVFELGPKGKPEVEYRVKVRLERRDRPYKLKPGLGSE